MPGPDREHPFSVHLRAAYMRPLHVRDAGEGAAGRKVPGAVKTAPYMAPVNGES